MKESLIQTAVETLLRYQENMGKLVYVKQNSGAFRTERGGFVRFGKAGAPDFMVYLSNGRCLHLEIKNEKGKQADTQKEYQLAIEKLGHVYLIARSVNDVDKALRVL